MKCPGASELRAFVDGELSPEQREICEAHVRGCMKCAEKVAQRERDSQQVNDWLTSLNRDEGAVDSQAAYVDVRARMAGRSSHQRPVISWFRLPQVGLIGSAGALVLLLSFSPAQTWAQRFLKMLRVQKLAVLPVNTTALMHAGLPDGRSRALAQFVSDDVVVSIKPGEPAVVPDLNSAAESVAFKIEALDSLGAPSRISVQDEGAFHMTLDADRIRAVLEEAGRSDVQIPDSVNGSVVAVHIAKGVSLEYGSCAKPDVSCIHFMQIPSPNVSVPPNLNIQALAEAGLQLAGLSAVEAASFAQNVDWSSTLVIPVPQDKANYRTTPVDGVNGTLIEWPAGSNSSGGYELIWLKDGVLHSVNGRGSLDQALAAVAGLGA